jgi:uncharacterized protein (DUF1786 family)
MIHHRLLLMDIGAGTLDILYYDLTSHLHYKAVVMSPVQQLAHQIARIPGDLVITGCEMGGGPVSRILRERVEHGDEIIMSRSAAATLHHHLERVESWGIKVVSDQKAEQYIQAGSNTHIEIGDLQIERIAQIVQGFGVPFEFEAIAVCAQDHGVAPKKVSHLDFRHNLFQKRLDQTPSPAALLYAQNEIPKNMNRLTSIARSARKFPTKEIYVMDSGMAAILGASMDPRLLTKKHYLLLDIATSHTVGAAMSDHLIDGFFEYHTHDITCQRIEELLKALANGDISHTKILSEGGHGAYLRNAIGFSKMEAIVATGPKRKLLSGTKLDIIWGAPLGDNMMTGTIGMLEAFRQRKEISEYLYI